MNSAVVPSVYSMGPESVLTRLRAASGREGTRLFEPDSARPASTIMTDANTDQMIAQPVCFFFCQRISAATAFMSAKAV